MKNNKSLKVLSTAAIAAALVAPTVAVQPAFAASTYSVVGAQNVSQDSVIQKTRITVEVTPGSLGSDTKKLYMRLPADSSAKVNGVTYGSPSEFDRDAQTQPGEYQVDEVTVSGAPTDNGDLELEVNGKPVTVTLTTADDTPAKVATAIATKINADKTNIGFAADANDGKIKLTALEQKDNVSNLVKTTKPVAGVTVGASQNVTPGKKPVDSGTGSEFIPKSVSGDTNQIKKVKIAADNSDNQYFTIEVTGDKDYSANRGIFYLELENVKVPAGAENGPFNATFDSPDNAFTAGNVKIAQVGNGSVKTSIDGTIALTPGSNKETKVKPIRIQEDSAGAFTGEYKLELPDGFEWDGTPVGRVYHGDPNVTLAVKKDKDTLLAKVVAKGGDFDSKSVTTKEATQFVIEDALIKVDDSEAEKGEVKATVKGSVSRSNDSIVIGTFGNWEGDIKAGDAKTVYAGQAGEELANLTIKEDAPGTLKKNRIIKLKLNGNAKWATKRTGGVNGKIELKEQPQIKNADSEKNNLQIGEWELSGSDRSVIQATITNESTNKPAKIVLEKLKVDVAPTAGTGDISVSVEGSAGITKDAIALGKTKAPVEISFDGELAKIDAGLQQQSIPNITIKEAATDVIGEKDLVVKFPEGVKPALPGKVEVTEGNLKIDSARVSVEDNRIIIPISKHSSTKAGTIKLSDIKVTSYRYVPEGDLKVKITGPAVVENIKDGLDNDYPFNKPNDTHVAEGSVAKVVTPADKNKYAENIIFKIGSKTYTQDGKEMTMDVAPEVHPVYNRTYIPAAHFAASLNIPADKVVWNEASKTVTIFAGDKVVSATAGKKELVVNGTPVQIDAPVNYGQHTGYRVMVPYTHLALALGATVEWKADTQEIFVNKR
ncbi:copper amine oxidase N-terminal domain-containing protein [Aneurinibacillus migulanus]|uniref:Copper amine oxidase N-terminal domain-containing protein n=1 Tax=Aneurinibacillus migulanus TaxID=47500 RepID=A0A0D1UZ75_ANEMI|nr:copper amine oxidase N-terminal domain-containing protein [Aneurinibacillus migulanus]KIV52399.1 hypothetical protein TS65_23580 [Aneurinibacillus migulanus]KON94573.1 hypothetical protein AF333_02755 [Aneurinibacillus migulanus]MED0892612.1 copper amine oxidase N-terminal domain-containing protein [Aneurinibacillus migulanus]MED1614974.1 copper amine oxidase N-terminal domain-containing protein [Aneurinibacillus migulanus]SDI46752.1 Copper amine oxidase N-terminal domain-containing protein